MCARRLQHTLLLVWRESLFVIVFVLFHSVCFLFSPLSFSGLFCNPAFLYAGYTAFSLSSSNSSPSSSSPKSPLLLSDASKMNWFSVNLLVMLQYLASGVSAFVASFLLSSSSLSLVGFSSSSSSSASISSLPFWLAAASEALGAFLMVSFRHRRHRQA